MEHSIVLYETSKDAVLRSSSILCLVLNVAVLYLEQYMSFLSIAVGNDTA